MAERRAGSRATAALRSTPALAFRDGKAYGNFTTVWQREKGDWRWVYDAAIAAERQGAAKTKPMVRKASCRAKAPGAPVIPPPPLTVEAGAH